MTVSTDRSNLYYQQLALFNAKAEPAPESDNVQIQKVSSPIDSATATDQNTVSFAVSQRPFLYGAAKYGQSEYGSYALTLWPVIITT